MINLSLQNLVLFLVLCFSSCNAQVKNESSNNTTTKAVNLPAGAARFKTFNGTTQHYSIVCSIKDRAGHLWFGTTGGGVYRYDGNEFVQFTTNEGLSHNHVFAFYADARGILWIGTADGISTWDGKSFTRISITTVRGNHPVVYQPTRIDPGFGVVSLNNAIVEIMQDSRGHFWFGGGKGLFRYDGKSFSNFTINDGMPNNTGSEITWIERIVEDSAGHIWFGGRTTNGVFRYDGKTLSNLKPNGEQWLRPMLEDKNGVMWFGNWHRIFSYDGKTFTQLKGEDGLCFRGVINAFKDRSGNIWTGGDNPKNGNGLCMYDGKSFKRYTIDEMKTNSYVTSITEDKDGNLWVATSGSELYRFDGKKFTSFSE